MSTFRPVSAAALVLVLGTTVMAQHAAPPLPPAQEPSQPTFRSATSMVALNVTVTDGDKLVTGLERHQFQVFEDGVQQQVQFFESTNVPLDLILLLDASSSMRERMPVVHEAARTFMSILRPGDRGAVVAFNDYVRVLQGLTSDRQAIADAINSTVAHGSTAMHNAIYIALKEFGRQAVSQDEVRRQAIAVLSDGDDTSSLVTFEDVLSLARKTGVNIYTIGLQSSYDAGPVSTSRYFSESTYSLNLLARETGARSFFPSGVHELRAVYEDISAELEAQYSIGYSPANDRPDGRFRRIIVRIADSPELRPRTRTGYTAQAVRRAAADAPGGQR